MLHKQTNERHALKVMNRKWLRSKKLTARVENEIRVHRQLDHKHILSLSGFFYDRKLVFIVLEFCARGNLFRYIKAKKKDGERVEMKEKLRFFREIAEGVDYLHSNGRKSFLIQRLNCGCRDCSSRPKAV